jgi:uncharacterized membrane-anchored protein
LIFTSLTWEGVAACRGWAGTTVLAWVGSTGLVAGVDKPFQVDRTDFEPSVLPTRVVVVVLPTIVAGIPNLVRHHTEEAGHMHRVAGRVDRKHLAA